MIGLKESPMIVEESSEEDKPQSLIQQESSATNGPKVKQYISLDSEDSQLNSILPIIPNEKVFHQVTFERRNRGKVLELSIQQMVECGLSSKEQSWITALIDYIVSEFFVELSPFHSENGPYSEEEGEVGEDFMSLYSECTTFFIHEDQLEQQTIVMSLLDSIAIKGKILVLLQNSMAQVLAVADGYSIEDLPSVILYLLAKKADLLIIENSSSQPFESLKQSPQFISLANYFVWLQGKNVQDNDPIASSQLVNHHSQQFTKISSLSYTFYSPLGQNSVRLTPKLLKNITSIQYLRSKIDSAIQKQFPALTRTAFSFVPYVIQNSLLLRNECNIPKQQFSIYAILNRFTEALTKMHSILPAVQDRVTQHFPAILVYPKYCIACKIDNIVFKRESSRVNTKKTKYRCIACSLTFRMEVRLCILCFKRFHSNIDTYNEIIMRREYQCTTHETFRGIPPELQGKSQDECESESQSFKDVEETSKTKLVSLETQLKRVLQKKKKQKRATK